MSEVIEVLGLPLGEDRQGHVVTPDTDIGLKVGDEVPVYYYHGFAERAARKAQRIGKAVYDRLDSAGHWFKVTLDTTLDIAKKVLDDAKNGLAKVSSDSIAHLVRPFGAVGKPATLTSWPIFALSVLDSSVADAAVNPRAVAIATAKAFLSDIENDAIENSSELSAKAGRVFAERNAARLRELRRLVDELIKDGHLDEESDITQEEPMSDNTNVAQQQQQNEAPATNKTDNVAVALNEIDAKVNSALKALDERIVAAQRLPLPVSTNANDVDAAKADDELVKAFLDYVRTGNVSAAAKATMNVGTGSQGGFLVPRRYSQEVVSALNIGSVLRAAGARVIRAESAESFRVPRMINSAAAALTAELAAYNTDEPTLAEITFTPYKYTRLSRASEELLANTWIDVVSQVITPDAINAFTLAENTAFAVGTGTGQPQGIFTGASVGVTAASATAVTADELINLYHSLAPQYRTQAVWLMNDSTISAVRRLKDTTNQYLWQPGLGGAEPSLLLGRPVYSLPTAPNMAAGNRSIVFANLNFFWIVDFAGDIFQRLNELYAANGYVGFRWARRFDSRVMLDAAVKALVHP